MEQANNIHRKNAEIRLTRQHSPGTAHEVCKVSNAHEGAAGDSFPKRMSKEEFKGKMYALFDQYGGVESIKIKYKDDEVKEWSA